MPLVLAALWGAMLKRWIAGLRAKLADATREAARGHPTNGSTGYFKIRPNVAGGIGENTVLDSSVHPPIVTKLHYEVEGWFGDVIVATFPCLLVTEETRRALQKMGFSGATFADAEVTTSEECQEDQPGLELPPFVWLKVNGRLATTISGSQYPSASSSRNAFLICWNHWEYRLLWSNLANSNGLRFLIAMTVHLSAAPI
ncbi:hypothetical protein [Mesorhizobium sp. L2C084A000]|uniref:hypothetical protein n=1 Tax=unclassified Mesorhizobium TaxID=325217 RepID=UPI00067EC088|nr:hypothetical protein [Mesorhizobium sp. L2C084A000]